MKSGGELRLEKGWEALEFIKHEQVFFCAQRGGGGCRGTRESQGRKVEGEEKADGTALTGDMKTAPKRANKIDY